VAFYVTETGEGTPVVLLHGLTATHSHVVMGSRVLERSGHRVIAYDARGHGRSDPAPDPGAYDYADLVGDLVAVLDDRGVGRAVLVGASMGAHTILGLALRQPERVAGLVVVTPSYDPASHDDPARRAYWEGLSDGLRRGGVEGFMEAYGDPGVPEAWRAMVLQGMRQRVADHEHPEALADALRVVQFSHPFDGLAELAAIAVPTVVVADRDEADPSHPLEVGEAYAAAIPGARLVVEEAGRSPIAWQGGQLSKVIGELAARTDA
jgi:pimeloyl-ACP methyl ester carboxylesterase